MSKRRDRVVFLRQSRQCLNVETNSSLLPLKNFGHVLDLTCQYLFVDCTFLRDNLPKHTICTLYFINKVYKCILDQHFIYYWSKYFEYNWFFEEEIQKLHCLVRSSLPYNLHHFQLTCTVRILDGQDVLCLSATGDGKFALMYLPSIARKGTITLVVCPTNFFGEWPN